MILEANNLSHDQEFEVKTNFQHPENRYTLD